GSSFPCTPVSWRRLSSSAARVIARGDPECLPGRLFLRAERGIHSAKAHSLEGCCGINPALHSLSLRPSTPAAFSVSRSTIQQYSRPMRNAAAAALVFVGGFIIMVLEIIGARFLAKDFGSSFHVWVSQIGVVLIALALGYYLGGALADRWQRLSLLVVLLGPAGVILFAIPNCAAWLIN